MDDLLDPRREDVLMTNGDVVDVPMVSTIVETIEPSGVTTTVFTEEAPKLMVDGEVIPDYGEMMELMSNHDDDEELIRPPPGIMYPLLPTGICYDARMRFHLELDPPLDRSDYHPEDPRRIQWIYQYIVEANLILDKRNTGPLVKQPLQRIPARHATRQEVCTVHDEDHFEFLGTTTSKTDFELSRLEKEFDSIYFCQSTYNAALLSAGGAIETCLSVAEGKTKNAIAVIRPPGHHALMNKSMGFCHFDNVAIAANVVREKHPEFRKILILDWDVHHGNGIQQAFESDPNVLYISLHVFANNFYPGGDYGDYLHCGIGEGVGKNVNIPWIAHGMGNADYMYAFQSIIMPIGFAFDPDMVIIAAGFDAAEGDQLGQCLVTPECYAHMTYMLMSLAKGKLIACLEGGYCLEAISKSALAVTKTLMGEIPPRMPTTSPTAPGVETITKVLRQQAKYWPCLYPKDPAKQFELLDDTEKMHDVVRAFQSKALFHAFKMVPVWVYRSQLSKSFENEVLATPEWMSKKNLFLIFHDPPEVVATPDPITGHINLHDAVMADGMKNYIQFATNLDMGVLDINVPKFLTGISDPDGNEDDENRKISQAVEDLAVYLWENYIEVEEDIERVVFLGVGDACRGIWHLLNTRTWNNVGQFSGAAFFIGNHQVRQVGEEFKSEFIRHYHKRSQVYVQPENKIWSPEYGKKHSKKFGRLVKSPVSGVSHMLQHHREDVEAFIEKCLADTNIGATQGNGIFRSIERGEGLRSTGRLLGLLAGHGLGEGDVNMMVKG